MCKSSAINEETPIEIWKIMILLWVGMGAVIIIGSLIIGEINKNLNEQSEILRSQYSPTRHEYTVLNVESDTELFGIGAKYYIITYLDTDNTVRSKEFHSSDMRPLKLVISNKSKFIIENPEYNGYPLSYILYYYELPKAKE